MKKLDAVAADVFLSAPDERYRDSYIATLREHQAQGRFLSSRQLFNDLDALEADFPLFVANLRKGADPAHVAPGNVPESFFWLIERASNDVVGRSSIRHALSDEPSLRDIGHIGYDIRPSKQRRGYGNAILGLTLIEARRFGMDRVLLTCNATNLASKRIIEHWGGVFERSAPLPGREDVRLRYWIAVP